MTQSLDYREIERRHLAYRRRQRMDLANEHALCESNYLRLLRILPEMATRDSRLLGLHNGEQVRRLQFHITERSRYTTCIEIREITQREPVTGPQWHRPTEFSVRAYHDTRMAEVTRYQQHKHLAVRAHYPNPHMLLPDERQQWNALLGEWLHHCLQHGYCLETAV